MGAILWSNVFHHKTEIAKYFKKVTAFNHSFIILNGSIQTQQAAKTSTMNYMQPEIKVPFSPTKVIVKGKPKYHESPRGEWASVLLETW